MNVINTYVENTLALLEIERTYEVEEVQRLQRTLSQSQLQAQGLCLLRLQVIDVFTGMGGRPLWKLGRTQFQICRGSITSISSNHNGSGMNPRDLEWK